MIKKKIIILINKLTPKRSGKVFKVFKDVVQVISNLRESRQKSNYVAI